jgi:hypothetical protein
MGWVVPTVRYQYLLVLGVLVSLTGSVSVVSQATNSPTTISLSGSGVSPVSTGPEFYVSPTGNDANSGTSSSAPWRTIQKAMNSATAGSVVKHHGRHLQRVPDHERASNPPRPSSTRATQAAPQQHLGLWITWAIRASWEDESTSGLIVARSVTNREHSERRFQG